MIYIKRLLKAEAGDKPRNIGLKDDIAESFFHVSSGSSENFTFIDIEGNRCKGTLTSVSGNNPQITGDFFSVVKQNGSLGDLLVIESTDQETLFKYRIVKKGIHSEYDKYNFLMDEYGSKGQGTSTHLLISIDDSKECEKKDLSEINSDENARFISALRTKPFLLLAGISGTGKSRIVRELARACWEKGTDEYKAHKPRNFEMVQVKPNWHDSSELIGYVSRIGEKPEFIAGDFLKFVVKAWGEPDVPYFLCLDEMNLAPVEQYFAEYLSVIESRKLENNMIVTDPLLKKEVQEWYHTLVCTLTLDESLQNQFLNEGISIPQNLFVIGTVNMDETTFSFSRKVLDRAMTIEMNDVDLNGGLEKDAENEFGYIDKGIIPFAVEGKDVYSKNKEFCDKVLSFLTEVNDKLNKTPFKIAYRTRNEFLVYAVCRGENKLLNSLDEMTSMKILSRIEGDADKTEHVLNGLESFLKGQLKDLEKSISLKKIIEMKEKLNRTQYTSFWS